MKILKCRRKRTQKYVYEDKTLGTNKLIDYKDADEANESQNDIENKDSEVDEFTDLPQLCQLNQKSDTTKKIKTKNTCRKSFNKQFNNGQSNKQFESIEERKEESDFDQ